MNGIEKALYDSLKNGNPKLRELFEAYVQNMGHTPEGAKVIVESIINDEKGLLNESLSERARFEDNE